MTNLPAGPNALLHLLEHHYKEEGLPIGWAEPSGEAPYHSLIVLFDNVGEQEREMQLELCFLPHMEAAEAEGVCFLQAFVSIAEGVSPVFFSEVLRLAAKLNIALPLGAFGLLEDTGVVYYKHNAVLLLENEAAANVRAIDTQNGLILHLHQLYMEAFLQVCSGKAGADEALNDLGY